MRNIVFKPAPVEVYMFFLYSKYSYHSCMCTFTCVDMFTCSKNRLIELRGKGNHPGILPTWKTYPSAIRQDILYIMSVCIYIYVDINMNKYVQSTRLHRPQTFILSVLGMHMAYKPYMSRCVKINTRMQISAYSMKTYLYHI